MPSILAKSLPKAAVMFVKELLPSKFFGNISYSQEGEDLILLRIHEDKKFGFYVDIGAHHPHRFSNTYLFYKRGWRGIVVDPLPSMAPKFAKHRPRDIAVQRGVAANPAMLKYYLFNDGALNTFDESLAKKRLENPRWQLVSVADIECVTLTQIFNDYLPKNVDVIDILSVDIEGYDLDVLRSNDWSRYRPETVVVECLDSSLETINTDPVAVFMRTVGYSFFAKAFNSVIFRRES